MKAFQMLLLFLSVKTSFCTEGMAKSGVASQSIRLDSIYAAASNAIDGNTDAEFTHGSCSATKAHTSPWWRVDLLGDYYIYMVTVWPASCCVEDLEGAEIRVGFETDPSANTLFGTIPLLSAYQSHTVEYENSTRGQYVYIYLPCLYRSLTLCEVEVIAYPGPMDNMAPGGAASMSSQMGSNAASNAIDGNTDPSMNSGSCIHTKKESNPWWRVDLRKKYRIFRVTVFNRSGPFSNRLNGAEIRIGNTADLSGSLCATIGSIPSGGSDGFFCNIPNREGMDGRFVTVVLKTGANTEFMHFCELEAHGFPIE